ncbi:MAG: SUF system Fe-S cluster assembly protein [Pseudolabrys sp.]|nr:SUF system Fe-S cluster assembly protein [Pseudolabrys sp.]
MSDEMNKPAVPIMQPELTAPAAPAAVERPIAPKVSADKPAENAAISGASALPVEELTRLTDEIIAGLKTVFDPEIPADIYELGLIYKIDIADDRMVNVDMSLTSPNCPAAQELPIMVENAVSSVAGVKDTKVTVVWDPPWDPSRMSDEARLVLNMW